MKNERHGYFEGMFEKYTEICSLIPEGQRSVTTYQRAANGVLKQSDAEYTLSEIDQLNLTHLTKDPLILKSFLDQASSFVLNKALL